jgi:hypothetical protein
MSERARLTGNSRFDVVETTVRTRCGLARAQFKVLATGRVHPTKFVKCVFGTRFSSIDLS